MPEISNLRGQAGAAGPIVGAATAEQMRQLFADLLAPVTRQLAETFATLAGRQAAALAEALAVVTLPTADPADELVGPHHTVDTPPSRN